jgi:hypothetical protein
LLDEARLERLTSKLREEFPQAHIIAISARDGLNLDDWLSQITSMELGKAPVMEVDYDTYAEGEALLGWLNATIMLTSPTPFDGNEYLQSLMSHLQTTLGAHEIEIAHLKMTLAPDEGNDLGVINLVRTDGRTESSHSLQDPLEVGELVVNLRAEADPDVLKTLVLEAASGLNKTALVKEEVSHIEAFRPGRPVPTHRDVIA